MKKNIRNILVVALALCVCAVIGFNAADSHLKADESALETAVIETAPDVVVEKTVEPVAAPAEAVEEIEVKAPIEEQPAEAPAEEQPAEAPAEEQPAEAPAEEQPAEVPAEEQPAEAPAEEQPAEAPAEEEAPVEKSIRTWFEYEGKPHIGMTVIIRSEISGYSNDVAYKWQYSTNGTKWHDAENGNNSTYTFVLDETTAKYQWRLGVYDYDPISEAPAA